jgi:hypothetical protein
MHALRRENWGSFPHVVIAQSMVSAESGDEHNIEYRSYEGPFRDRRESEAWAQQRFAGDERVTWEDPHRRDGRPWAPHTRRYAGSIQRQAGERRRPGAVVA